MAHCVISAAVDTDTPGHPSAPACMVHTHWAPCPLNGEAASLTPIHSDDRCGRDEEIRVWRLRTHGQRPLIIHRGSWANKRAHRVDADDRDCWCEPELIDPEAVDD